MQINEWLNQPYPGFNQPLKDGFLILLVGVVATGIFILARPFGLASWPAPLAQAFIASAGTAAVSIALFNVILLPRIWPRLFTESGWTVKRQILFEIWYLFTIAMGLLSIASLFGLARLGWTQVVSYTLITAAFGIIPLIFKVLLTQIFLLKRNLADLRRIQFQPNEQEWLSNPVELRAETTDRLELIPHEMLFVVAQQNYCEIWWLADGKPCKHLLRQKIGVLAQQLKETAINRTHRSYLANLDRVVEVLGNAQGYRLKLDGCDEQIPLSRRFAAALLPKIGLTRRR